MQQQALDAQRASESVLPRSASTCLQGDMQISLQVLRDELAVNEERFSRQLQQWRKVAEAQRRCSHPARLCAHALCILKGLPCSSLSLPKGAGCRAATSVSGISCCCMIELV